MKFYTSKAKFRAVGRQLGLTGGRKRKVSRETAGRRKPRDTRKGLRDAIRRVMEEPAPAGERIRARKYGKNRISR